MATSDLQLFTVYFALLSLAVIPVYIGSFKSLRPSSVEAMSSKDAYLFPVLGSCVLFSIYLLFKFLSKEWINFLMSIYFMVLGVGAISAVLSPIIKSIVPYEITKRKPYTIQFSLPSFIRKEPIKIELHIIDIVSIFIGSIIGVIYITTKHWVTNNIIGECFAITGIELVSLGSFKIACTLLIGLFFYDVFWVFGTDVMETVAKAFDAPVKVIWPRGDSFSLLGLGDIVIPGVFIALMLRFDRYLAKKRGTTNQRLYFHVAFVSYIASLITTVLVLHVFKHGQPALLYIVPYLIISVLLIAFVKGDLGELLAYNEEQKNDEEKKSQ